MSAKVLQLHPQPSPVGHFLRVGHSGFRQLETLQASGRLPANRFVVEAARIDEQRDLIDAVRRAGSELILDSNAAELATVGRYQGAARRLPWANPERPWSPDDFGTAATETFVSALARFAVENRVHTILSPTRVIDSPLNDWLRVDLLTCEALRVALDREGGKGIAIDYPLLVSYSSVRDEAHRRAYIARLKDLPCDYVWLRISGFGADATPVGLRRYLNASHEFHVLDKPVVADGVGGFAGLAIVAFGGAAAISHGVAERERFNAVEWRRATSGGGGGQTTRVYVPALDRHLDVSLARKLFELRGVKSQIGCNDIDCCPMGVADTLRAPKAHFLNQRARQLDEISSVPELRRVGHFIDHVLRPAERTSRKVAKIDTGQNALNEMLSAQHHRISELVKVLVDLHETAPDASRSLPVESRARRLTSEESRRERS